MVFPSPVYKYHGVLENRPPSVTEDSLDKIYYVRVALRLFSPFLAITVQSPTRKAAWRLCAEYFDYRSAQNSGALMPRDGEWMSRSETNLYEDLSLLCPAACDDIPEFITAKARLSWWPAHVTFTWISGDSYQKIAARPKEGTCEWEDAVYDESLFDAECRARYPKSFEPLPPVPPRPDTSVPATVVLTTPPPDPPVTVPNVTGAETSLPSKADKVTEESGHSPNQSPDENHWDSDWWSNHNWWSHEDWGGHWSESEQATPTAKTSNVPDYEHKPDWADQQDTPRIQPDTEIVTRTSPVAAESATRETLTNSTLRVEQVTVQTRTQSLEVTRDTVHDQNNMIALHKLALTGPPLTREDRLARQVMANTLSLTPALYNLLVFGETDLDTEPSNAATCALPPPEPSSSP